MSESTILFTCFQLTVWLLSRSEYRSVLSSNSRTQIPDSDSSVKPEILIQLLAYRLTDRQPDSLTDRHTDRVKNQIPEGTNSVNPEILMGLLTYRQTDRQNTGK